MKEILITSSVLIGVLLVLRLIFAKKVRRTWIYAAWALVALRLLIPVQVGQLDFSVLTAAQPLTDTVAQVSDLRVIGQNEREADIRVAADMIRQDLTVFTPEVQEYIQKHQQAGASAEEIATALVKTQGSQLYVPEVREQIVRQAAEHTGYLSVGQLAAGIWILGTAVMAVWFVTVNVRHGRHLRQRRQRLELDSPIAVYRSEQVSSPCLVGLFRPVIYLTPESADDETERRYVLTHELTHYRHGDHIWSAVRCICLCVYWFDPLVWVAAWCSRRDCELACDEGALKRLGQQDRIAYGKTLLDLVSRAAAPTHLMQTATSMHESGKQLKERLDLIVKKPKWSIMAAVCMVLLCAIVAGCTAAGPRGEPGLENTEPSTGATEPTASVFDPTKLVPQDPEALLAMIPETVQTQMKQDYLAQFAPQYIGEPGIMERITFRVFGVFGDSYVLFVDGIFGHYQVISRGNFGLVYPDSQVMYLYRDGCFYKTGLTPEERSQLACNYYNEYPSLKDYYSRE